MQTPTEDVLEALFGEVYSELRKMAQGLLINAPPNRTIQATVLVHEAYLRLSPGEQRVYDRADRLQNRSLPAID